MVPSRIGNSYLALCPTPSPLTVEAFALETIGQPEGSTGGEGAEGITQARLTTAEGGTGRG